jgi:hypothetical protein
MILILEIAFLITGIYAIATGKMPSLIVGKRFKAEGRQVRLLGILMAGTMPAILLGTLIVGALGGLRSRDGLAAVAVFEFLWVIGVGLVVAVALRRIRKPD